MSTTPANAAAYPASNTSGQATVAMIARQAIVNAQQEVIGYELFNRSRTGIGHTAATDVIRLCCTSRKADEITPAPDAAMPWHPRAPCSGARVA